MSSGAEPGRRGARSCSSSEQDESKVWVVVGEGRSDSPRAQEPRVPGGWQPGWGGLGAALVEQWAGCEGDRPGWQPGGDRQGREGPTLTSRECRVWFLFTQDRKKASLIPDAAGVRKQQGLSTGVP